MDDQQALYLFPFLNRIDSPTSQGRDLADESVALNCTRGVAIRRRSAFNKQHFCFRLGAHQLRRLLE